MTKGKATEAGLLGYAGGRPEEASKPRIKLCGLSKEADIEAANLLLPEYIGFVFAKKSRRYVDRETAKRLKKALDPRILAVGVFVDEEQRTIAEYLSEGIIDIAQLHGNEDEAYIKGLRKLTDKQLIKAFRVEDKKDIKPAEASEADHILLDAGRGDGKTFDWSLLSGIERPYFLAGGLTPYNVAEAVKSLNPFGVDVSSGIETDGIKDIEKMKAFVKAVRGQGGS